MWKQIISVVAVCYQGLSRLHRRLPSREVISAPGREGTQAYRGVLLELGFEEWIVLRETERGKTLKRKVGENQSNCTEAKNMFIIY